MSTAENYLRDLVPLLLERAKEAKRQAINAVDPNDGNFLAGRRVAYYEVVATVVGQLDAFGLSRTSFGVPDDFDPERDLL